MTATPRVRIEGITSGSHSAGARLVKHRLDRLIRELTRTHYGARLVASAAIRPAARPGFRELAERFGVFHNPRT